jgi:glycosyltransferase involved in cell wall biosynthesis
LIIQIPCYNEEETLKRTLDDLPRSIDGIDTIEVLVINDGSTDRTIDVARESNVNHILSFNRNTGLARAFAAGIEKCLELGADIIVNTDADNQYRGDEIPKIVNPILQNHADVVVGDRQTDKMKHFSLSKRLLQKLGSACVRRMSNIKVADAVSGFRAYSKQAAMCINILTDFSYTVENLIQLGSEKLRIESVVVKTNKPLRKPRLHRGMLNFILNQARTVVRSYSMYKALKVFTGIGVIFLLPGLFLGFRFLYFYLFSPGRAVGHIQSLILAAVLIIVSVIFLMLGIIADLISDNRKLIERLIFYHRKQRWM